MRKKLEEVADVNREEMIKELKSIDLRAIPTVATMDMGLQYDFITSEGTGTGFGGMGDWPAHMFRPKDLKLWQKIREDIKNNKLAVTDLEDTGLDVFLENVNTIDGDLNPSEG